MGWDAGKHFTSKGLKIKKSFKKGLEDGEERKMSIKINIPVIKCSMCECEYERCNFLSFGGVSLFSIFLKKVAYLAKRISHKHSAKAEKNLKT